MDNRRAIATCKGSVTLVLSSLGSPVGCARSLVNPTSTRPNLFAD
jgi:hypothetical protein